MKLCPALLPRSLCARLVALSLWCRSHWALALTLHRLHRVLLCRALCCWRSCRVLYPISFDLSGLVLLLELLLLLARYCSSSPYAFSPRAPGAQLNTCSLLLCALSLCTALLASRAALGTLGARAVLALLVWSMRSPSPSLLFCSGSRACLPGPLALLFCSGPCVDLSPPCVCCTCYSCHARAFCCWFVLLWIALASSALSRAGTVSPFSAGLVHAPAVFLLNLRVVS